MNILGFDHPCSQHPPLSVLTHVHDPLPWYPPFCFHDRNTCCLSLWFQFILPRNRIYRVTHTCVMSWYHSLYIHNTYVCVYMDISDFFLHFSVYGTQSNFMTEILYIALITIGTCVTLLYTNLDFLKECIYRSSKGEWYYGAMWTLRKPKTHYHIFVVSYIFTNNIQGFLFPPACQHLFI